MIKDSIIYFLSKFLPAIFSFITIIIFLTHMRPKDYGLYSVYILTIGLIGIFTSQWIRSSLIRFYYEKKQVINQAIIYQIIIGIIIFLASTIIKIILDIKFNIWLTSVFILISTLTNEFYNNYFRIRIEPNKVLAGNLVKNGVFTIFLLVFMFINKNGINLLEALIAYLVGLIVSDLYYSINSQIFKNFKFSLDKKVMKKFLIYGLPLTISFTIGVLMQNIDKYMITNILGSESTGDYSIVFDFIHNYLYMIMGSIGLASLPRILKQKNDQQVIEQNFQKYLNIFHYINLPVLFIFIMFSPEMAIIVNSNNYSTDAKILIMISFATYFHGINTYIYGQGFQLLQNTKSIIFPNLIAIIINVIINLIFLKKYGIIISAISILLAFIISNILLYYKLSKIFNVTFYNKKILVISLIMIVFSVLIMFSVNLNLYLSLILKFIIIIICLYSCYYFYKKRGRI